MTENLSMTSGIGAPEHEKMGKGVTLSAEELKKLRDLLNVMSL